MECLHCTSLWQLCCLVSHTYLGWDTMLYDILRWCNVCTAVLFLFIKCVNPAFSAHNNMSISIKYLEHFSFPFSPLCRLLCHPESFMFQYLIGGPLAHCWLSSLSCIMERSMNCFRDYLCWSVLLQMIKNRLHGTHSRSGFWKVSYLIGLSF